MSDETSAFPEPRPISDSARTPAPEGCEGAGEDAEEPRWLAWTRFALGAASLAASLLAGTPPRWRGIALDPAWIAVVACGWPILREAAEALVERFDVKADLLVALAILASLALGEVFAAAEVAFIMMLGEWLEERTVAKARGGIERLARLAPPTARLVGPDGAERAVAADSLAAGDVARVLPGESVPADGRIRRGRTSIDESLLTGESVPVDKGPGDPVTGGAVNRFGAFDMVVERPTKEGELARMVRLVATADASASRIVRVADRWATWIVVAALAGAAGIWLATGEPLRGVTVLVVFCPCALVLATPTAIMAAIGNASRHGFLVRAGDALERLAGVSCVAFDKTGTLTEGVPRLVGSVPLSGALPADEVLRLAAGAERLSEHPLGRAVVRAARARGLEVPEPHDFRMEPGRGVRARVDGRDVAAGTAAHVGAAEAAEAAAAPWRARGCTVVHVAVGGAPAGFLALADEPRPDAAAAVAGVRAEGAAPVLLTGDHEEAAREVARRLGIEEVRAACLPEDKLAWVRGREAAGRPVCMIGDGVNDAPALAAARVGIALGGTGTALAVDAADIVLVGGGLRELPHLLALSRRTLRAIRRGLAFSLGINIVAAALAMGAVLDPVSGALVHNAGAFFVIANAATLLRWRRG